jgi:hypothetical protein
MKALITTIAILTTMTAQGQLDYMKIRDTVCPQICGFRDSIDLEKIYPKMLLLRPNQINKDLQEFYHDLAVIEYELYIVKGDTNYLRLAANSNVKAFEYDPEHKIGLWNAAFAFGHLGDCEKMWYYLNLYQETISKRKWKTDEQIGYLQSYCD